MLTEVGALLLVLAMLRTGVFGRRTALVGLATHGLDLVQITVGALVPALKVVVMAVAGSLYLAWFALVGRPLLALALPSAAALSRRSSGPSRT